MVSQPAARRADLGWAALVCALVLALKASFVWAREGFVDRPRRVGSGDARCTAMPAAERFNDAG